jgi:hypothetical protein
MGMVNRPEKDQSTAAAVDLRTDDLNVPSMETANQDSVPDGHR